MEPSPGTVEFREVLLTALVLTLVPAGVLAPGGGGGERHLCLLVHAVRHELVQVGGGVTRYRLLQENWMLGDWGVTGVGRETNDEQDEE